MKARRLAGLTALGPLITRQRPEVPRLACSALRIQHRCPGLVHEQLGRSLQISEQRLEDRLQFTGRLVNPAGKRRAIKVKTLTTVNLRLFVKRQVVGIFADQNMGDARDRRQPPFD